MCVRFFLGGDVKSCCCCVVLRDVQEKTGEVTNNNNKSKTTHDVMHVTCLLFVFCCLCWFAVVGVPFGGSSCVCAVLVVRC